MSQGGGDAGLHPTAGPAAAVPPGDGQPGDVPPGDGHPGDDDVTPGDPAPDAAAGASGPEPARARWALLLGVASLVLALDQLTKAWAVEALGDGRIIDLVGSLRLRLTINHGSAFSLTDSRGSLVGLAALAVVAVLLRSGRHATRPGMAVALGLVVGGAFGNLVDRAFRAGDGLLGGGVVDFVDLQWWPVFNLADSAVVCGALLLLVVQWREPGCDEPARRRP